MSYEASSGFATAQRAKAVVSGRALGRSGDAYAVTEGGSQLPDKRRHVRTLGSGARVDLAGLGDSVVAVAHLPIDVRAAGAIGAGAVHAFVGDGVHRQWGRRRTVLDLLAGPQNPNYEGPVIEGSSSQVLTAGQCATRTGACDDRSWLRVAAGRREAATSTPAQARLTQ